MFQKNDNKEIIISKENKYLKQINEVMNLQKKRIDVCK